MSSCLEMRIGWRRVNLLRGSMKEPWCVKTVLDPFFFLTFIYLAVLCLSCGMRALAP